MHPSNKIDLTSEHCAPVPKGTPPLDGAKVNEFLGHLPGWSREGDSIVKTFRFKNYHETMAFVNATAWISHREDHHPDLTVTYNTCAMRYSTHSAGGLSMNDFISAAKVEKFNSL